MTSPVVSENFGLGVGYSLFENVGQKMLHFSFCQSRSVTLKYATNAFAAGAYDAPQTPKLAGEADTGYPSPHATPLGACGFSTFTPKALVTRRLRCLDPRTFGACQSVTPTVFLTNRTLVVPCIH